MEDRYLGDGVYASYDGYHINLAVNHHTNHVVALDSSVMENLKKYEKDIEKVLLYNKENS